MEHPMSSENRIIFAKTSSSEELQYMTAQNYIQERGHNQVKIQTDTDMQIEEDRLPVLLEVAKNDSCDTMAYRASTLGIDIE